MQQQPVGRGERPTTPVPVDPLVALADASSRLRNLQQRLSLAQGVAKPLPVVSPLPARVDDRMSAAGTRARKSVLGSRGVDRMSSEAYPLAAPPVVEFVLGDNSRLRGRPATVVYA